MKEKMCQGTYCGRVENLRGRRALVRTGVDVNTGSVLAQFDEPVSLSEFGAPLNFGWHRFPLEDFDLDLEMEAE